MFVDPFLKAIICLGLDEKEQTFDWLEKAVEVRSSFIPALVNDPKWDPLRNEARFQRLLAHTGTLSDEQAPNTR